MALRRRGRRKSVREPEETVALGSLERSVPRVDELSSLVATMARRQMALTYHLIRVLDAVERDAVEPETLKALYSVDHDANRLRRAAESLLLMVGGQVSDGLEGPVTLLDVARAAQCASADVEPVTLTAMPPAAVLPGVSDDLVHVLAALLDNAISFSPASSRITLSGHQRGDGSVLLKIADRGPGVEQSVLAELNARLAVAPVLDGRSAHQTGLHVVAIVAHRHRLRVQLDAGVDGGTVACVTVPSHLIISPQAGEPEPASAAAPTRFAPPPSGDWWEVQTLSALASGSTRNGLPQRARMLQASGPWLPAAPPPQPPDPQSVRADLDAFEAGERRARRETTANQSIVSTSWEGLWE